MELYFIGCRASSEAIPKYMHSAFAIEVNNVIYWFDAGEGCSYTAHLMGVDLLKVKEIFISHPHMDHVGGLGNLLWNMRKLTKFQKRMPAHGAIGVHISDMETWAGLWKVLKNTEEKFVWECGVIPKQIMSGEVYRDENISVSALHNNHMENKENGLELSFSFTICCEGKRIIYSGDIKGMSDLDALLEKPCDYLFIETAHQTVEKICAYVNEKAVKTLVFLHHRREITDDIQKARMTAQRLTKCNVYFAEDGDILSL